MHEPSTVQAVSTIPGYTAVAVVYNGCNLDEVRRLVEHELGPCIDAFTPYPQQMQPPVIRVWDGRTGNWQWAKPGDCVIADRDGVLILDHRWFYALFQADPLTYADQLGIASHLLGMLQGVFSQMSAASTSPAAADIDPGDVLSARNLSPVTFESFQPVVCPGDVWADGEGVCWTVTAVPSGPDHPALLTDGRAEVHWGWLSTERGPLHLVSRFGTPIAA